LFTHRISPVDVCPGLNQGLEDLECWFSSALGTGCDEINDLPPTLRVGARGTHAGNATEGVTLGRADRDVRASDTARQLVLPDASDGAANSAHVIGRCRIRLGL